MDIGKWEQKLPQWVRTYRYPLLIALVGLALLLMPSRKSDTPQTQTPAVAQSKQTDASEQLAQVLGQIDGVGKVKVMLSVSVGETTRYHSDEETTTTDTTTSVRKETVIVTDADRAQMPLVSQVIAPEYRGAVIVCQGGDDPKVKWAVVEAVSKATGLGANQISVLKMK